MTTDDDMREIEAALHLYAGAVYMHNDDLWQKREDCVLSLIRQKLEVAQKPATCQQPEADVAQNDDEWLRAPLTEREKASTELAGKVIVPWTDDAEHERAVEAWRAKAESSDLTSGEIDEALRLMRARPVADKAAGELLRAAKDVLHNFHVDMEQEHRSGFYGPQDVDAMIAMDDAIQAAERAGVR